MLRDGGSTINGRGDTVPCHPATCGAAPSDAISQHTSAPYPILSTWQFEWQRTPEGLKVVRITCLKIGNETGTGAGSRFPKK